MISKKEKGKTEKVDMNKKEIFSDVNEHDKKCRELIVKILQNNENLLDLTTSYERSSKSSEDRGLLLILLKKLCKNEQNKKHPKNKTLIP